MYLRSDLYKAICALVIAVLGFGSAHAQQPLSLEEALRIGLANNLDIEVARAGLAVAEYNNDWSFAGKYPRVNATLNADNGYSNVNNPASVVTQSSVFSNGITPGISTNWVIFDGYRVEFTKQQLEQQQDLSAKQFAVQFQNTMRQIITNYYTAWVQKEQLAVLAQVLQISRDRVAYQELRNEYGQAGTFEILQAQEAYLGDSTNYLVQANNYANALRNLRFSMGVNEPVEYLLTDGLEQPLQAYDAAEADVAMIANNADLRSQRVNIALAAINTKLQNTGKTPQVSLNAGLNYGYNVSNGSQTFNLGGSERVQDLPGVGARTARGFVNLSASYTLWDGNARQKRVESARLQELQAQMQYQRLEQSLRTQLNNALATYRTQQELVAITTTREDNARRNLEIASERYRGGLINSFDYRSIQLSYANAGQAKLNALLNLKLTETELLRLTGGLVQ